VQERGLLVNPLDPILSHNKAIRLRNRGEHERAERLLLRLLDLPEPPGVIHIAIFQQYVVMGELDRALYWAKQNARIHSRSHPETLRFVVGTYERLGLREDSDFWLADVLAHTPQPEDRFWNRATQLRMRGNHAGLQEVIEEFDAALGTDMNQLHIDYSGLYASANILVGNFDVGIDVFESAYDLRTLAMYADVSFYGDLEYLHVLAYGYQQVGRDDEADALLARLYEHLNELVVEQKLNSGDVHHLRAQNFGMRGEFDAAADALEAAIEAGWLWFFPATGSPLWTETIADPRIARMLDEVKVELERQRAVVVQADAEHDFRAELEALRSAPDE